MKKLILHTARSAEEIDEAWDKTITVMSDGLFRFVECTLVLATLKFLELKTGDALLSWAYITLFILMALRIRASFIKIDLEIWPRPVSKPQRWMEVGLGSAFYLAIMAGALLSSSHIATVVAKTNLL